MINLTKEELVKLAEFAGYKWLPKTCLLVKNHMKEGQDILIFEEWQPDKDIAQVIEVLDTWGSNRYTIDLFKNGDVNGTYHADLYYGDQCFNGIGNCYAVAICKAVLKALGGNYHV